MDPIEEVSIVCLLSSWTRMLNLISGVKVEENMKRVEKQIEEIKKIVDKASVELRSYERIQEERLGKENETNKK